MNWLRNYEHWTPERILRHILYWMAWSLFYVFTNFFSSDEHELWQWVTFELLVLPIKMGCTYFMAYYVLPAYLEKGKIALFAVLSLLTFFVFGMLLYIMYSEVVFPIVLYGDTSSFIGRLSKDFFHEFIFKGVELIYIAGLFLCIKYFQNSLIVQQKNNDLKEQKIRTELKYLKNQIQPHFLFNTLNNIYGMVLTQDPRAAQILIRLSDMLSYMMYESEDDFIPLRKEIKNLEDYIALEMLRHGQKLDLDYQNVQGSTHLNIAPLILIAFVENAFKHGPGTEEEKAWVKINIHVEDKTLHFYVANSYDDNASSDPSLASGIGLENVKKRLSLIYRNKHELKINKGEYFEVRLKIILEE